MIPFLGKRNKCVCERRRGGEEKRWKGYRGREEAEGRRGRMQGKMRQQRQRGSTYLGRDVGLIFTEESQKAKADHQDESALLNSLGSMINSQAGKACRNTAKRSGFEFQLE